MNWIEYGRKRSWPNLKYYPSICLEELRRDIFVRRFDPRTFEIQSRIATHSTATFLIPHTLIINLVTAIYISAAY
jgi:hypothetical protein